MSINREQFQQIFESKFNLDSFISFSKEFFNEIETVNPYKNNTSARDTSEFYHHIEYYNHIGNYTDNDKNEILILAVKLKDHKNIDRARSMQRNFVKKILEKENKNAAFVAFYADNDVWRLSFIKLDYEFISGKIAEKLTPAKRYSYLVGVKEPCHTAMERMYPIVSQIHKNPNTKDIEDAFSVEKVTKEFFEQYKEKYLELKESLDNNENFIDEAVKHNFTSEQFAKKLMGQLAFLYFLQKKGWLGVRAIPRKLSEKEYRDFKYALPSAKRDLSDLVYEKKEDDLYVVISSAMQGLNEDDNKLISRCLKGSPWGTGPRDFIRELFKACEKKKKNFFDDYLEPLFYKALNENRNKDNHYFTKLHCRIPFLNGGLFEPLNNYDWDENNFDIDNKVFSNENGTGILDVFDRYNFTMNEDEPLEKEVAIDPEMLGKIFENLLDVSDRKSKGAFYTPREIVHYMCRESIANYLVNETKLPYDDIKDFIIYGEFMKDEDTTFTDKNRDMLIAKSLYDRKNNVNNLVLVDNALQTIKVADPAVGSGAFPLGMVSEIVKIRRNITEYLAIDMNAYSKLNMYGRDRHPIKIKRDTIKNCIFAVDIDESAVDITKLRLWLSIAVEEQTNENETDLTMAEGKNPTPLPNLDANIRCGNSLIDEFEGIQLIDESQLYIKDSDAQMLWQSAKYDSLVTELIKLQDRLYGEQNHDSKEDIKQKIASITDNIILDRLHTEKANSDIIERYNDAKNKPSPPYFLWKLEFANVFKEKGGFDVVIGNPPYIKELDNKHIFEPVNNTDFGKKYHQGKMDFWYYFLHLSINITKKNSCISLITPSYWLKSNGATKLISHVREELNFKEIISIGKIKTFDNVEGYHMIAVYIKNKEECDLLHKTLSNTLSDINSQINTSNIQIEFLNNDKIFKNGQINLSTFNISVNTIKLSSVCDISQGIVEACDKISKKAYSKISNNNFEIGDGVFVLNEKEYSNLPLTTDEKNIIKVYLDGKNISRYSISYEEVSYVIYSDKEAKELIASSINFINIKRHLDKYADYITSSNKPYGLHRPRKISSFNQPKLITPSMFKKNMFVYDDLCNIVGMSYSILTLNAQYKESFNLKFLLAVLNSKFALFWFYQNGKHRGAGVDIGVEKLREFELPIDINTQIQNMTIKLVDQIITQKQADPKVDTSALEAEIDQIVYKLYDLTEEEMKIVEESVK